MTLSADGMKGVKNVRNAPFQKTRALTVSIPLGLIMAGHLSMADLLNLAVLWDIPVQKNDDFTVKVDHTIMNANARTHQSMYAFHHLQIFILLP